MFGEMVVLTIIRKGICVTWVGGNGEVNSIKEIFSHRKRKMLDIEG